MYTVLQLSRENEREGLLPDFRVGVKESESEDRRFKLNALAARTATYFEVSRNYDESDDRVTRQATIDRQQAVR